MSKCRLLVFLFVLGSLSGGNFSDLEREYRLGGYDYLLSDYEQVASEWLEEGKFTDFLANRRSFANAECEKILRERSLKKANAPLLDKIETDKNSALQWVADHYPHARITPLVDDILCYHTLRARYDEAVDFFRWLESGGFIESQDSVIKEIEPIIFKHQLKSIVVSTRVIDCRIDSETAYFHKALLDLERDDLVAKVCKKHPDSDISKLCLQALKVNKAMLPVALNQQYLSDLIVGIRAPASEVEDFVRQVLQNAHARKEAIFHPELVKK